VGPNVCPRIPKAKDGDFLGPRGAGAAAKAGPTGVTAADVGDADSFGRGVVYLGLAQTGTVWFQADCTPDPSNPFGPDDRCIVLNPAPDATFFEEAELAVVRLPPKATHSIVCQAVTPRETFQFNNTTGVPAPSAAFNASITVRVESVVLNDPTLIDPATGLPYNGSYRVALPTYSESRSLAADERASKRIVMTRDCIGGLISRAFLVDSGLAEAQADAFFKNPITLHVGAQGSARLVDFAAFSAGIRLYGD
jgi:hypothetical protein